MVTLFATGHMSFYADIMSISRHTCLQIHRGSAWMVSEKLLMGSNEQPFCTYFRVVLTRPMRIDAGQYINLWMPSVTWWSWAQVHPFMVTSWSHSAQEALDILIQPRRGLSHELLKHARAAPQGSASLRAFIIGPHGRSENVDRYESVVLVASGFGIAAAISYLKKLVYSYNTSASRTRRVHLVWEVETLDIAIAVQATLNSLLEDDVLKKRYIIGDEMKFGNHGRAVVYNRHAKYDQILRAEMSGELIERLPGAQEEKGESLVLVAASSLVRDQVRLVLQDYVHRKAKMAVLEYQP
uniref:Ferric reductase transmembrane component 3 n=1 Tax=Talaromyces marneffei PM1 TaxID=1077442 RepID=A0A093X7N0_TALMA